MPGPGPRSPGSRRARTAVVRFTSRPGPRSPGSPRAQDRGRPVHLAPGPRSPGSPGAGPRLGRVTGTAGCAARRPGPRSMASAFASSGVQLPSVMSASASSLRGQDRGGASGSREGIVSQTSTRRASARRRERLLDGVAGRARAGAAPCAFRLQRLGQGRGSDNIAAGPIAVAAWRGTRSGVGSPIRRPSEGGSCRGRYLAPQNCPAGHGMVTAIAS
jgi:hypothetical protein